MEPDRSLNRDAMLQVFFWMAGDPCKQPKQLNHKDMKPCVFHKHHDYFQGSELAYILGIMLIVLFPLIVIFTAYIAVKVSNSMRRSIRAERTGEKETAASRERRRANISINCTTDLQRSVLS